MNKSTKYLLIIFVILAVIVIVFFKGKDKISTQNVEEKLFIADSSKIDKIEIARSKDTIVLEKIGGLWKLSRPVDYPCDTNAITPLLSNLQNFKIESVISENPKNFGTYFDTTNNSSVTVYQEGKQLGSFILGKSGQGYETAYLKRAEENRVLLASKLGTFNFTKPLKDYRNKQMLALQTLTISKIECKSTDSNKVDFTAIKDTAGRWFIGADSVAKSTMEGFTNLFINAQTDDFKDTVITQFPEPTYSITIHNSQPGIAPVVINFYKQATTPVEYIVQISNNKQLFKFSDAFAASWMKKRKDLIPEPQKEVKTDDKKK
jgi:hypothetical protein